MWKIYYEKDVTEGKVDYLTQNLAYGSLQRLEGLRKFGFGSWGVYGEPDNYEIRGVMMWKGTEITQTWKEHPSFMFHKFEKLNPTKEPDVECILAYWLGQQAEGLPRKDSKLLI